MAKDLNQMIKEHFSEKEAIELLEKLVSSPSHVGIENQETGVAIHIHDFFTKEGIAAELIPVCDGRCNVIAKLKGKGTGKTLLLTGHTDTVPPYDCLLYTSDAADEEDSVDLGGRRIIKKK